MNTALRSKKILRLAWIAGILLIINFIPFSLYEVIGVVFKTDLFASKSPLRMLATFFMLCIVLFYLGFADIGNRRDRPVLRIAALAAIPLFLFYILTQHPFLSVHKYLRMVIVILVGLNSVLFGLSLFNLKNIHSYAGDVGGVLQIVFGLILVLPFINIQFASPFFLFIAFFFQVLILVSEYNILSKA
jgi:hypothetical protein